MAAAVQPAAAKARDDAAAQGDAAAAAAIKRLVGSSKYAPPKIVSFPIDALKVTGPISLAGNS
jgi:hypothetical protein